MSTTNELTGEPALWYGLASGAVQLAAAFFLPWNDETVAIVNAAIAALFGVWVALRTKAVDNGGSIKGAILGAGQALINLAMVFGWHATDKQTAALMLFVTMATGVFIRQTSAPAGAAEKGVHAGRDLAGL
ncbi:hypothetical protein MF672_038700 [Actinomadura sp. ATCC 31491]|uniref:Holin n=1 Tax=Actinomadura luzonensis TaxID=2805427 RepID=A0ABT0G505_9ACTN|nr:hypothetical protein [Actinomadura luzonensis]MCK2219684.1 hypothetical protein [Actinomadura luzonensis]